MTDALVDEPSAPNERRSGGSRHIWFLDGAFDRIDTALAYKRVTEQTAESPFRFVVTPNVDHLVRLSRASGAEKVLYAQAWLTVCDSRILELMAKISGEAIPVAPGSDLTEHLFETAIAPDEPVNVIGGSEAVINAVEARYGLTNLRWYDAPMGLRRNPFAVGECAAFVAANPARFTFICVGSPQQEMIASACLAREDCFGVGLCVGASLEFLAGTLTRAPVWMRRARLEWLHRLMSEPTRLWRRYLVEGPKVVLLWLRWRRQRQALLRLEKELVRHGLDDASNAQHRR
ncbi:MAG: WecB/TagA/CpsF family glycosyltransferase [Maricaulaceae bacterium]